MELYTMYNYIIYMYNLTRTVQHVQVHIHVCMRSVMLTFASTEA